MCGMAREACPPRYRAKSDACADRRAASPHAGPHPGTTRQRTVLVDQWEALAASAIV